ncbi:MAG TPA: type II toxin-antitoxin system VapC family toxin [Geminicoccaceae bacterium]
MVLDASALLACIFREPGYDQVDLESGTVLISAVNLAEVLTRLVRDGLDVGRVLADLAETALEVVPFDTIHARRAAELLPRTQPHGLSLGDRACLALALQRELPALTADRAWTELEVGARVVLIR